ncbi:UDP-N-acetylglucosamine 1-carboxyvinyltransferase [Marivibrio halodurans]|uniref:UDP-N-acetylglucosamine 1-carboxyvinyltransferase n=1 Tax=Marivibrio halodurans TaxID=2039722 RepID=A0A8J7V1A8_9PROT|nr:UDP-N-acetylglucosamine 1-carboxyvinyltransferase [Marivibrio halodurans]MBP5857611.1 UDP-N-acetylglucosamine 1-carboxyvinyltransferase [Marivibrio halodurans]
MDSIRIKGGRPLVGEIRVGGAKNAALPLMTAALLSDEPLILANMPRLADIETMKALLEQHGVTITLEEPEDGVSGRNATLDARGVNNTTAPYDIVRKMRASVLVLGPLVARHGQARVSLPGGCAIGTRPVDLHLKGLEQLGAEIELDQGYILAHAPNGLTGADIVFPFVSVGATENLLMAACLAQGTTRLKNAAREPEVTDLAECLNAMGARVSGIGTDTLVIEGVESLGTANHAVPPDRIETGSLAMAAAATGGDVTLLGARPDMLEQVFRAMGQAGAVIDCEADRVRVRCPRVVGIDVMTEPYPGFPTDLQAQMMAMLVRAEGASMITESIFENRFMHVPELCRMGANINLHSRSAMVRGVARLTGAEVMATDLRASMSLVIAGLVAEGETVINRVYHLDRGYERLERKLATCGADIERVAGR